MTDTVVVAIIASAGTVLVAMVGLATAILTKVNDIKVSIDGRLQELLDITREASKLEGIKEGKLIGEARVEEIHSKVKDAHAAGLVEGKSKHVG